MHDRVPAMLENILWYVKNTVQDNLRFLVILLLLRIVLRRTWLALAGFAIVALIAFAPDASHPLYDKLYTALMAAVYLFILVRFGLLAICVGWFLLSLPDALPTTFDFSAWYAGYFFVLLLITTALLAHGCRFSLAGRPMLGESALEG
jgi:hypothetical protein